jgi:putative transposase
VKKSKYSEEQIVRILKEVEAGAKVAETIGKYGVKVKCASMAASQLRHLRDLEQENARLKRMYSDLAFEHTPSRT